MKIVSYNVRCSYVGDGINSFVNRAGLIYDKIKNDQPDVIAFQEVTAKILDVLQKLLTEYVFVGQFRNEDYTGEGLYTAVRKDSCMVLGYETIWLSPTPYVAGSRFEIQSSCPRICVQTLVRHNESGKRMRIYNLHLDHKSEEARVSGMKSALEFVQQYYHKDSFPAVILGDFNAHPDSQVITMCNAYPHLKEASAPIETTFHKYGTKAIKIDYIYMSDELADAAVCATAWTEENNGIYLSDHYPICVQLEL